MAQYSTGVVKWFNNKAGYGFLTVMDEGQTPEDIFVHHSQIQVGKDQYKYLVQGEYVEFVLSHDAGEHKCLATSVRGVNGGKLMCETRAEHPRRESTNVSATTSTSTRGRGTGRFTSRPPLPLPLPLQSEDDQVEWLLVKRKRTMPNTTTTTTARTAVSNTSTRGRGRRPMAELS